MESSKKMLKTASFMAIATFLAKVCGMARDMLIAAFFGTGIEADAYMTATRLPTTLFDIVIGGVISAAFIPVFNSVLEKESKEEANSFANRFIGLVLMITGLIAIFGIVFSDALINFMAPDFGTEAHNLAAQLSSIMFPMIIFTGLAFSFVGILQSYGEYNIPAIMSLISNLVVILYFAVFGKRFGVYGLAFTMLAAWGIQVVIQIPSLVRFKFRFRPSLNVKDKNIRRAMMLALPMLISTWVQPLYTIVNTRIASGIYKGVSSLEYANRLYIVITGVFSFVVTNLIFPKMSRANVSGNEDKAKAMVVTSLKSIAIIILPIMAIFIVLAKPIIAVLYQHGGFVLEDTIRTGTALSCYSVGMIGMAFNEILSKSFFSMQNSKTPMINALISMAVNILIAYSLAAPLGISGLALATAAGSSVNALLNYICISKHYKTLFTKSDIINTFKIAASALIMAVVMLVCYRILVDHFELGLVGGIILGGISGVLGIICYVAGCLLLRVDILINLLKGEKNSE
ncbi:MAG: murein biosynthesis integral membrane protein MurJ [Firmicutes bacterium]|nr:murein biosynthesis integral membrane protein MurJ [Bacillota bacterium]